MKEKKLTDYQKIRFLLSRNPALEAYLGKVGKLRIFCNYVVNSNKQFSQDYLDSAYTSILEQLYFNPCGIIPASELLNMFTWQSSKEGRKYWDYVLEMFVSDRDDC